MRRFKDNKGREWDVEVNVTTAKRVRELASVDVFNLYVAEAERVFSDPVLLVNVLYVLCLPQCRERGVSDENFGEALTGDSINDAASALLDAVADFFPSSRQKVMRRQKEKSEEITSQLMDQAMTAIEAFTVTDLRSPTKSPASSV